MADIPPRPLPEEADPLERSVEAENSENVNPSDSVSNNNDSNFDKKKVLAAGSEMIMPKPKQEGCDDTDDVKPRWKCGLCIKVENDLPRYSFFIYLFFCHFQICLNSTCIHLVAHFSVYCVFLFV